MDYQEAILNNKLAWDRIAQQRIREQSLKGKEFTSDSFHKLADWIDKDLQGTKEQFRRMYLFERFADYHDAQNRSISDD